MEGPLLGICRKMFADQNVKSLPGCVWMNDRTELSRCAVAARMKDPNTGLEVSYAQISYQILDFQQQPIFPALST